MAGKENNFPPLPRFLPLKPCFYQDIPDEIPIEHQVLVKRIYLLWMWVSGGALLSVPGFGTRCPAPPLQATPPAANPEEMTRYTIRILLHGWLVAVGFFQVNVGAAVVMLIPALMFTQSAVMMAVVIMRVHRIYHGAGGSFQKAQTEWNSGTWRNPPSREAQLGTAYLSTPQSPTTGPVAASGHRQLQERSHLS